MLLRGGQSERRGELRKEEKSPVRRNIFNSENRIKCENLKKKEVEKSIIDPSILYLQEMSLHTV